MNVLMILNDPPYGNERTYNALRLAMNLQRNHADVALTVFLMGDATLGAKTGQQTPDGYYNIERMLKGVLVKGGRVLTCGTCIDTRGITEAELLEGATRSSMDELGNLTLEAERVLVF